MSKDDIKFQEDYKYGFKDKDVSILKTDIGLNEDIIRQISKLKNEPDWMLEYRLKSYQAFLKLPLPSFGPDLSNLDYDTPIGGIFFHISMNKLGTLASSKQITDLTSIDR